MEPTSQIILHLYGEHNDPEDLVALLRDEEVRLEYEAMGKVKDLLDSQPPARPGAGVIDAIMAEAVRQHPGTRRPEPEPTPVEPRRQPAVHDRQPAAHNRSNRAPARRTQRRSIPAFAGALAAVILLIGLSWWHFSADGPLLPEASAPDGVAATEGTFESGEQAITMGIVGEDADALEIPDWDESDALLRLRRQMEFIQARSSEDAWDEPVIPLEMRDARTTPTLTSAQR